MKFEIPIWVIMSLVAAVIIGVIMQIIILLYMNKVFRGGFLKILRGKKKLKINYRGGLL